VNAKLAGLVVKCKKQDTARCSGQVLIAERIHYDQWKKSQTKRGDSLSIAFLYLEISQNNLSEKPITAYNFRNKIFDAF